MRIYDLRARLTFLDLQSAIIQFPEPAFLRGSLRPVQKAHFETIATHMRRFLKNQASEDEVMDAVCDCKLLGTTALYDEPTGTFSTMSSRAKTNLHEAMDCNGGSHRSAE